MKGLNTWHKADDITVPQRLVMSAEALYVGVRPLSPFGDNGWLVIDCDS